MKQLGFRKYKMYYTLEVGNWVNSVQQHTDLVAALREHLNSFCLYTVNVNRKHIPIHELSFKLVEIIRDTASHLVSTGALSATPYLDTFLHRLTVTVYEVPSDEGDSILSVLIDVLPSNTTDSIYVAIQNLHKTQ